MGEQVRAIPDQLTNWASWADGQNSHLKGVANTLDQAIERFNQSKRSPGIIGSVNYAGNDVIGYVGRNAGTDTWVGQVGRAFLSAAAAQLPGGVRNIPGTMQELASGVVTASNAQIANLAGADPVQLAQKQGAAEALAARLQEAADTSDGQAMQEVLNKLAQQQDDPAYNSAFFKQLGVGTTLFVAYQLGASSKSAPELQTFDQALGSATRSSDWDPTFNQQLFAATNGTYAPPLAAIQLLKYGTYSQDFLETAAGAELRLEPYATGTADPWTTGIVLNALARNPQASLSFLLDTPPAYQAMGFQNGQASGLELLLTKYHNMFNSGEGNQGALAAMNQMLTAAGQSPLAMQETVGPMGTGPEVKVLLQELGTFGGKGMVPPELGTGVANIISGQGLTTPEAIAQRLSLLLPPGNPDHYTFESGWNWQENVVKLAETDGTGHINTTTLGEIEHALGTWALVNGPTSFNQDSGQNIEQWRHYLEQAGALSGLVALPVRQAPYDAQALRQKQLGALGTVIGMLPFGSALNKIPGEHPFLNWSFGQLEGQMVSLGKAKLAGDPNTPQKDGVQNFYVQRGQMRLILAEQFLADHRSLIPQGENIDDYASQLAQGNVNTENAQVQQFYTDLANADSYFGQQYDKPKT